MNIYGITFDELEKYFINRNDKKFKATQVFDWVYRKRINNFEEMRNVSKETISTMKNDFYFEKLEIIQKQEDVDVAKYLFRLKDGEKVDYQKIYAFHNDILDGYTEAFSGDRPVLFKMKELWSHMLPLFPKGEVYAKNIRKVERISEYQGIAAQLFGTVL
jgi:hypothetical protein